MKPAQIVHILAASVIVAVIMSIFNIMFFDPKVETQILVEYAASRWPLLLGDVIFLLGGCLVGWLLGYRSAKEREGCRARMGGAR